MALADFLHDVQIDQTPPTNLDVSRLAVSPRPPERGVEMACLARCAAMVSMSALVLAITTSAQTPPSGENIVTIRGEREQLHHHPPTAPSLNQKVLFIPGVGGWFGWATTIADIMASWGYDVEGLDTKIYLDGFSRHAGLTEADIMNDLHQLVDWMTNQSGERVALVGWSEGAGLSVLAAAADGNRNVLRGVAVFGLGDENAIAWHRMDNLESLIKKPNEPTFRASDYMAKIAPLPFFMIQSTHDQYTPLDEAQRLFALAHEPKRFAIVEGRDHRFDGNQEEFFRTLREALEWIDHSQSGAHSAPAAAQR
jgi:uncharacterized protein